MTVICLSPEYKNGRIQGSPLLGQRDGGACGEPAGTRMIICVFQSDKLLRYLTSCLPWVTRWATKTRKVCTGKIFTVAHKQLQDYINKFEFQVKASKTKTNEKRNHLYMNCYINLCTTKIHFLCTKLLSCF